MRLFRRWSAHVFQTLLTHWQYDSYSAKFLTRDPIGYDGGQNLYNAFGGNPINETDPSGTSTAGDYALGALDSINPVEMAKGLAAIPGLASDVATGRVSSSAVGGAILNSFAFWNQPTRRDSASSFTTDALCFADGLGLLMKLRAISAAGKIARAAKAAEEAARATKTISSSVLKGAIPDVEAQNLWEKLVLEEAKAGHPDERMIIGPGHLGDEPRLTAVYGGGMWVKMEFVHRLSDGTNATIHWFRNLTTGKDVEFKWK